MKLTKVFWLIAMLGLCGCADLQDAMPGMSYSDRTLLEGIQACATYSMDKAVSDLDEERLGDQFWDSNTAEFKDFELILIKLKKEAELKKLKLLLNQSTAQLLKMESKSFNDQITSLSVSEDPEELMEGSSRAITDYYMGNLKVQGHVGDSILKIMQENGAQTMFLELTSLYNNIPYQENPIEFVLHSRLSSFLLSEISDRMAFHEKELRTNPLLRQSKVLQKTFSDYDNE
jgi:hypothetical protein